MNTLVPRDPTARAAAIALRGDQRRLRRQRTRHARELAARRRAYARRRAAENYATARDKTRRIVAALPATVRAAYATAGRKLRRLILEQHEDDRRWVDKHGLPLVENWL